jgi:hypothetical protein
LDIYANNTDSFEQNASYYANNSNDIYLSSNNYNSKYLKFPQNTFEPGNYQIYLSVSDQEGSGESCLTFSVEAAPSHGIFLLSSIDHNPTSFSNSSTFSTPGSPLLGTELSTIFHLSAHNFTSPSNNYPLKYTYELFDGIERKTII